MDNKLPPCPPWRIKLVSRIPDVSEARRRSAIREAGYNTFLLRSRDVTIDLLTDSGTNAMYDEQRSAMEMGDEAYAGPESYFRLEESAKDVYGVSFVAPTHQGRAAEHIASRVLIKKGQYILSNMYFTTSRAHAEARGAKWINVSVREASDAESLHPFKGNVDLEKLEKHLKKLGRKVAFVRVEACLNMAGGQPFSLENFEQVKAITKTYGVPLLLDATRAIENSYFIKIRERGMCILSIRAILREICKGVDWIVVSAKKDAIVNIGGLLCVNDPENYQKANNELVMFEGFKHYGGLAGRDMEAIAKGLQMAVDDKYIEHRVEQTRYFGGLLFKAGIPIVVPMGGHGIYINAEKFLPHVPQAEYTAQTLSAAIYEETGIRGMERGLASAGRDPKTGREHSSDLELVRLTIPRMVYTESHFAHAAESIRRVYEMRDKIKGLKMVYEPPTLRFFQARFEKLS